jgi:hypothetical protein
VSAQLATGRKISALRSPTWGATSPRRFHECPMPGRSAGSSGERSSSEDSHRLGRHDETSALENVTKGGGSHSDT